MNLTKRELQLLNVIQGRKPDDTPQKLHVTKHQWEFLKKMKADGRIIDHEIEVKFD